MARARRYRIVLRRALAYWLPAAFAVTVLAAGGLVFIDNLIRAQANDLAVALAGDAAGALAAGAAPSEAVRVGLPATDIYASPRPWVAVFDGSGGLIASTATDLSDFPVSTLNLGAGTMPNFTWQPRPGIREAVVVRRSGGDWVVAGQSLAQPERHKDEANLFAATGWIAALGAAAMGALLGAFATRPGRRQDYRPAAR